MSEEALANLVSITRLGIVTILLWVLSRVYDLWIQHVSRKSERNAYLRAIYAEVDFNTFDMTRFLDSTVSLDVLAPHLERPEYIPHITDARHTEIYRSRIGELDALSGLYGRHENLVGSLVQFYGELEKVTQQIEGLSKPSFVQISAVGKAGTISRIYKTCAVCEGLGKKILSKMERAYPQLRLEPIAERRQQENNARPMSHSDAAHRLEKLTSDLNRVNSGTHSRSPHS
tara:strand:- start:246 stop:935 length:690 start_codon:yes stop_codon:yes gene_type:complete